MASYRIFRLREQARLSFRSAPHTSGESNVKLKDYEESGSIEAANPYEAWELLRAAGTPIDVGDLLETELGAIQICKYIGFEPAKWIVPEGKQAEALATAGAPAETSQAGKL